MSHDYIRNILNFYYLYESPPVCGRSYVFLQMAKERKKPTKHPPDSVIVPAGGPAALLRQT